MKRDKTFGPAYVPALDRDRITGQMREVMDLMQDGCWRTLRDISQATGAPESSASAQLRHLRKPRFGSYVVEKRRRGDVLGLWEYRLLPPCPVEDGEQLQLLEAVS